MSVDVLGFVYAATVAAGGIFGYVKAKSIPSLGAGLAFGSVLGYGALQTTQDPTNIKLSVAATMVLGGLMGFRYYNSGKMMPAGMLMILSGIMLVKTVARSFIASPMKTQ